jgi:hypothetical protein
MAPTQLVSRAPQLPFVSVAHEDGSPPFGTIPQILSNVSQRLSGVHTAASAESVDVSFAESFAESVEPSFDDDSADTSAVDDS